MGETGYRESRTTKMGAGMDGMDRMGSHGMDGTDTAATQARAAWRKVVSLVGECKEVRQEVEQVMAKMQSLLS